MSMQIRTADPEPQLEVTCSDNPPTYRSQYTVTLPLAALADKPLHRPSKFISLTHDGRAHSYRFKVFADAHGAIRFVLQPKERSHLHPGSVLVFQVAGHAEARVVLPEHPGIRIRVLGAAWDNQDAPIELILPRETIDSLYELQSSIHEMGNGRIERMTCGPVEITCDRDADQLRPGDLVVVHWAATVPKRKADKASSNSKKKKPRMGTVK